MLRQPDVRAAAAAAGGSYTVRLSEYAQEPKLRKTLVEQSFAVHAHSVSSEPFQSNWVSEPGMVRWAGCGAVRVDCLRADGGGGEPAH